MNFLTKLGGWAQWFDEGQLTTDYDASYGKKFGWIAQVFGPVSIVLYVIMGLVGAAGAIYAIYLGIQLARADDQSKRDEAKKHLITVLIAVACTIVGVLFFNELLPLIVRAFVLPSNPQPSGNNNAGAIIQMVKTFIR